MSKKTESYRTIQAIKSIIHSMTKAKHETVPGSILDVLVNNALKEALILSALLLEREGV